jgi:hypothetical protein
MVTGYQDKQFLQNFVILTNKIDAMLSAVTGFVTVPASFAALLALTNSTVADFKVKLAAITGIDESNDRQYIKEYIRVVQQMVDMKVPMSAPVAPVPTGSDSGGSLATGTYYYRFSAIDAAGGESILSNEVNSGARTGPNASVAFAAGVAINGAVSYKAYRGTATGPAGTLVSYPLTASQFTTGFTDTGAAGFAGTTATLPTVPTAVKAVLTDTEFAAAVSTGTKAALLSKVTGDYLDTSGVPPQGISATIDAGAQWL